MRQAVLEQVKKFVLQSQRSYFVGTDLGFGLFSDIDFSNNKNFLIEPISESHAVGMAAGMASEENIVFINNISSFLIQRAYEQISHYLSGESLNVTLIGSGGGVVYAPLGPTHFSCNDIAILNTLPNFILLAPADKTQACALLEQSIKRNVPKYLRLAKGGEEDLTAQFSFTTILGKPLFVEDGHDILLITTGVTFQRAFQARELLNKEGIKSSILHLHTLKPIDAESLRESVAKFNKILTIEEHYLVGGLFQIICTELSNCKKEIYGLGFPDKPLKHYGKQEDFFINFGLDKNGIVRKVKEILNLA